MRPAWANGAMLLVPVTEEQIAEASMHLKPHKILQCSWVEDGFQPGVSKRGGLYGEGTY